MQEFRKVTTITIYEAIPKEGEVISEIDRYHLGINDSSPLTEPRSPETWPYIMSFLNLLTQAIFKYNLYDKKS